MASTTSASPRFKLPLVKDQRGGNGLQGGPPPALLARFLGPQGAWEGCGAR